LSVEINCFFFFLSAVEDLFLLQLVLFLNSLSVKNQGFFAFNQRKTGQINLLFLPLKSAKRQERHDGDRWRRTYERSFSTRLLDEAVRGDSSSV
jgi:hypothetical protein